MDEYISKQAVLDALNVKCMMPVWCKVLVEKMLKDLPPAQPGRKKGKWIREVLGSTSGYGTTVMYQCSECERMSLSEYNFCPNCGAEMRKDGAE